MRSASRALAWSVAALGAVVLVGWAFDILVLKAVLPGLATMKPNTALCFLLGGGSLTLWWLPRDGDIAPVLARSVGALVLMIGAATLVEYIFAVNLGLDAVLFPTAATVSTSAHPARMAQMTALSFTCLGSALVWLDSRRAPAAVEILATVAALVSLTAIVGYAYGVRALYAVDPFSTVALHTALGFAGLSLGILFAHPDRGMVAIFAGENAGGAMVRRLVPVVLVLPLALGWLRLQGERAGLYTTAFGTGMYAVANVVVFAASVFWFAASLSRSDVERRHAEQELKRSNEELERFAYVASHDLQEPLRMVGSYVALLQKRYSEQLDTPAGEFIAFALDGVSRMQRLIADLLEYSRVSTRGAVPAPTNATDALERSLADLKLTIDETGARVTRDPMPTLPADKSQLEHVFVNLIGNALKFRGSAPPMIHVSAAEQHGEWVFSVRDNGIGIDPRHFDRIFVIFQRLHGRDEYPGTGMGLAITKRIIERHGGRIWVESQPGQGTTFFFTLPAIKVAA